MKHGFMLLFGCISAEKPLYYCAYHECGGVKAVLQEEMREMQAFKAYVKALCRAY